MPHIKIFSKGRYCRGPQRGWRAEVEADDEATARSHGSVDPATQGSKKVKQQILDEFCETTGYCHSYARYGLRNHERQVWLREKQIIVGDAVVQH